jgi:acetoin utilization deacetylase AcuC-like enzyme
MKTGIVKDNRYLEHNMGDSHPETPKRLEVIYKMIDSRITYPLFRIEPRPATEKEILMVHTPHYFDQVKNTADKKRVMLDSDTSTSARSFNTALLASGGVLNAIDHIIDGDIQNGFALIRPPGHHAEASHAMGFCLFNNIAIGAEYLLKIRKNKRVLIVDWDLHHGNGTQHSFEERSDVLYFSTHQFPYYPGTGHWSETGKNTGKGYTVNIPLYPGKGDKDYRFIFKEILRPVVAEYKPDFILVSAGFDIYQDDPLGGMNVSGLGFGALTRELTDLAEELCENRLLILLEGGYHLEGQSLGVRHVLDQLSGNAADPDIEAAASPELSEELEPVLQATSVPFK